jgi:exonuclease SbcC
MRFFSRLMGKKPASNRAVSPAPQAPDVARPQDDPAADVRTLEFGDRLLALAFDDTSALQRPARQRIAELIDARVITIQQLPADPAWQRGALAIAAMTADPGNFDTVANRIVDPATWVELAVNANSAKLRQLAAMRVAAPDDLRTVMKAARERDKNVYRIAKSKLDALNAEARRAEQAREHMRSLADAIERHSYKPFDGAYVATIDHLEREWRALDVPIPDDLRVRVETAIDRARDVIAEQIRVAAARAAHEAAVANAQAQRNDIVDELRKLLRTLYAEGELDAAAVENVRDRIVKLTERWNDTLQYRAAEERETQELEALRSALERAASEIAKHGAVSRQLESLRAAESDEAYGRLNALVVERALFGTEVPAIVDELLSAVEERRERQAAARASVEDTQRRIAQLIRKAQQALASGSSRQALGIRRSIAAKLDRLSDVPKHLADRLQALDERLQELQDWKRFAVAPKRSELIAQMHALIGSDLPPPELAEEIRRLQEEWRSLAKGGADSDEEWTQFHAAAEAAYAPCKAYFERQAQVRAENLEKRKALVARVAQFEQATNWDEVDWKQVAGFLRTVRQEWRDSGPTERAATKPVERQFEENLARIQARLDAEYAANLARKQKLVEQAKRLATIQDLAQAAEEVKRLQAAWRNVGLTPHERGQRLWEEFKRHCDAVFEQRRKLHSERMAELEQNAERALTLCQEAESLSQRSGSELQAGAARLRELRESFAQLGEFPRARAAELQQRFRRAVDEFEKALAKQRHQESEQAWDNFFDAANRVRLLQLEGGSDADSVAELIRSIETWPKGGKQVIETKLGQPANTDLAANEAALRELTIRAEIMTGTETPESDQAQRRAMQLQALVSGTGRSSLPVREQIEALAFEWAKVGPVPTATYDELFGRFRKCWQRSH